MNLVKKIDIHSEMLRHYRSTPKKVGLRLNLTIILTDDAAFCTRCMAGDANDVSHDWSPVLTGMPYRKKTYYDGAKTSWRECETHGTQADWMTNIVGKFWIPAEDDRPSLIVSESKAMSLIAAKAPENAERTWNDKLRLEQIFSQRIQSVLDAAQEQKKASDIAQQANQLITHITTTARQQAKTNTDFDAKLAALKAEFEAEQEACLVQYVEHNLLNDCEEDADTEWHPRAIELAGAKADECLSPAIRPFKGRGMGSQAVKIGDVFPPETPQETEEKTAIPA
jgi:hypothetical protein